jgi:hypothetical protein
VELGLPYSLTRRGEYPPPPSLVPGGGAHSLAREGLGEFQFRRGDIHCGTLYIYVYFVQHTDIYGDEMRTAERSSINSDSAHSVKKHTQNLNKYTILKCCFHHVLCIGKYTAVSNLNQREQIRLFDERIFYNTGNIRQDPSSSSSIKNYDNNV